MAPPQAILQDPRSSRFHLGLGWDRHLTCGRAFCGEREGGQGLFSDHSSAEPFIGIKLGVGDTLGKHYISVLK